MPNQLAVVFALQLDQPEGSASGRLKDGEPFPSISHKVICVPAFTIRCCFLSFVPFPFFVLWYSFSQMCGFSSFPQFWLLSWSWEQWVLLLQYGYGVWGIFCCYPFLLDFVQRMGPGILHLYARTTLLHSSAFSARIFAMLSRTLSLLDKTRNSRFRFFIWSSYASHSGEGSGCMDVGGDFTQ